MQLQLSLLLLLGGCLLCAGAEPVSQSKSLWDQIKANAERQPARVDDAASSSQSPSLRLVLESKKARRNLECRPDFCYRPDATAADRRPGGARICGTDGKTYQSRCMLQFLRRCHGQKVKVRHLGPCGAPLPPAPGADGGGGGGGDGGGHLAKRTCQQSRLTALLKSSRGEQVIFVPQCRGDGNFRRVQCNYQLKYCFCVRKRSGKPLPGSGVQLPNRPRCKRRRRGRRRKRPGKKAGGEEKQQKKQKQKKQKQKKQKKNGGSQRRKNRCSSRQRAQFNRNILKQFEVEFNASVNTRGGIFKPKREASGLPIHGVVEKTLQQPERRSAEWKFSELDDDSDGQLSYRETKALRKVTRANIKPKNCARRFFSTCDINSNKRLERAEWILCFGLENSAAPARVEAAAMVAAAAPPTEAPATAAMSAEAAAAPAGTLDGGGGGGAGDKGSLMELLNRRRQRSRPKKARPFARKSCPLAREEALAKNRLQQLQPRAGGAGAQGRVFVPECAADGRFAMRQCHNDRADRLCFCMDPDSGRVLKSRGDRVDCEAAHLRARAAASAGFRGCSQAQLRQFSGQLTALLVQETRDAWTPQDAHLGVEARSLRLRFQRADVNRDGRLDRKEQRWWRRDLKARWKSREQLRHTRKCAANFLRFCNADGDAFVTLPELQACLSLT